MNLRNALRYIYIYRLNLAKAGWEYDLQPREKWRETEASGSQLQAWQPTGRHAEWSGYRRMGGRPWGYIIEIPDHARRQLNMHCFRKWRSALWIRWNDEEVWAFWFKQPQVRHLCGERCLTPKGVTA